MIQVFRKNQRVLMLAVAILTIVAFIFLYNTTQLDELATVRNPTIYGKSLTPAAIDRQVKNYQLTLSLGQFELLQKLGGTAAEREIAVTEFVWNLLVLQHQARELGIEPTDDQVADRIKDIPLFQTEGQFDPAKYTLFVSEQLAPRGFTERQLEEVIRDALRLDSLCKTIEAPATLGAGEMEATARIFQPVTATYAKFERADTDKSVTVTPEEIAAFHQQNQAALMTSENREAQYVAFALPEGSPLEGREKVDALQKLANTASQMIDSLAEAATPFEEAAKKAGAEIKHLAAFERSGAPVAPAKPSPLATETMSSIAPAVFLLEKPGTTTDVIQAGDCFYVVALTAAHPARPLTLAEATPQIERRLRAEKAARIFSTSATSAYTALQAAVSGGKSFAEAAAAQHLKVGRLEKIVPAAESTSASDQALAAATLLLKPGELSNLEQAPWGAFAVQLDSRGPTDTQAYSAREQTIRDNILRNKRDLLFAEWLRVSREAARITMPGAGQG
jgi:peptidyl-prolyl cis-trans isomerase D